MSEPEYDLTAIGNALVDVLAQASDAFIEAEAARHGMHKGSMNLIDEPRAVELYSSMGPGVEVSGGSAGNTVAGLASFGGKVGYIGKVADDELGNVFRHDLRSMDVTYRTQSLIVGAPTGRCLILVTPDAERTMNTFLGASHELSPVDIETDADLIASSKVTYLEGYLFDPPQAKQAFELAAQLAHDAGHRVALTLSDPFCVDRHRADFVDLVENHIDILFANETEIISLYETETFEQAFKHVAARCEIAVLTRGEKGAVIVTENDLIEIDAVVPEKVLDSTGAGDQFAAGFLYGLTQEMSLEKCGKLGALAAAEVISHMGPRPEMSYKDLLERI